MSIHVIRKGIKYFKKNGFKKSCKRTVYFFMDKQLYSKLMKYTTPSEQELQSQRETEFGYSPKISIIIPMYNTPKKFFKELVDSIINQTYANWELCLADGTGKETDAAVMIKEIIENSPIAKERIKYKMLDSNDGISGNTNGALEMATGEYIALVDHDDIITVDALYHVVKALNENPLADSLYSDEDKMDYEGKKFFEPHFKPDFNIDYLRHGNYICHLFVTKTAIAREIGGFRKAFDGAQDFDFIFRCTEKSREVAHVPRVLYHWRCHPNSTAARPESKMYAYEAGVKSVQEHFDRVGIKATAQIGNSFGYYKINLELIGSPLVTVITGKGFKRELANKFTYENWELMESDSYTPVELNALAKRAKGEYILFLNPNITGISSGIIQKLLGYVQRADVAMACARTNGVDKKVYHAGFVIGVYNNIGYAFRGLDEDNHGYFMRLICPHDVSAMDMSCTLVKKEVFSKIGGFSEDMNSMEAKYWSADFCLKIEELFGSNGKMVYNPYAKASISENGAMEEGTEYNEVQDAIFNSKWSERIQNGDKYYNLNLTKEGTDFSILSWAELRK